jgi:hypothetical protein
MGEEQRFMKDKFLLLLQYCSLLAKTITIKEGIPSKQDAKVRGQGKFNQIKSNDVPSKRYTQIIGARKLVHDEYKRD